MKNTNELVEAMKVAKENGYNVFGIRTVENDAGILNVGDECPDSYNWDFELDCSTRETTGEKLNGACAVEIRTDTLMMDGDDDEDIAEEIERAFEKAAYYYGEQVLLIGGKFGCEHGDDDGEVIIEMADVLAIVNE